MIDVKVTKEQVKNHLYYSKWVYLATLAVGILFFNLLFSATMPQTPKDKKVEIIVLGYYLSGDYTAWEQQILDALPEDQQEVSFVTYSSDSSDELSNLELIQARMATQQGDIFLMDVKTYQLLATTGAFLPLDREMPDGGPPFLSRVTLPEGLDPTLLTAEFETVDAQGNHVKDKAICGVSMMGVRAMLELGAVPDDMVAAVTTYSVNQGNALAALEWIFENKAETALSTTPAPAQ
jgi:hypothetical protein